MIGSIRGRGGGPAGRGALQAQDLFAGERVGPDPEQFARLRVKGHQRLRFDADGNGPAAEDLGGQDLLAGEPDKAAVVDRAVDLDGAAIGVDRRQRRRACRRCALACEFGEVSCAEGERRLLTRAPPIVRWMTSTLAQKRTVCPARAGPSQNWRWQTIRLPDGGTTRSNSIGPPSTAIGAAPASTARATDSFEHLAAAAEAAGEQLAVIGEHLLGRAVALERLGERQADRAGGRALDDAREHAIARVIVHAGTIRASRNSPDCMSTSIGP